MSKYFFVQGLCSESTLTLTQFQEMQAPFSTNLMEDNFQFISTGGSLLHYFNQKYFFETGSKGLYSTHLRCLPNRCTGIDTSKFTEM